MAKIIDPLLKKPPCAKCPYTLGQVHMLTSPCPLCKLDGYKTYERLQKMTRSFSVSDEEYPHEPH